MMVTGWIVCHCGQEVPAYLAGHHVTPGGAVCEGIREGLHTPGLCLDCRQGTHGDGFTATLETIRRDKGYAIL